MIVMLCGTSDARELAQSIQSEGYDVLTSVVTDNAAKSLREVGLRARVGRLTHDDMVTLLKQNSVQAIVDASHPFAEEASRNARKAAEEVQLPYVRFERERQSFHENERLIMVADYEEAANVALQKKGVIMLTTGSKTLPIFTKKLLGHADIRLIARMLPRKDNMEKCEQLGVEQKNIVAIQGPFTKHLNKALYEQYGVTLMITKESGRVGAVDEKVEAALECGIETVVIKRPKITYGTEFSTYEGVLQHLKIIMSN